MKRCGLGPALLAALPLFLCFQVIDGTGRGFVKTRQRDLETQVLFTYELEGTSVFDFVFNGSTPELNLTAGDLDDVTRLTEIFFRRTVAAAYGYPYYNFALHYRSHDWEPSIDRLRLDFDATATFRTNRDGTVPSADDVLKIMAAADAEMYIRHAVSLADPQELFLWANSSEVTIKNKHSEKLTPTSTPLSTTLPVIVSKSSESPTKAPTFKNTNQNELHVPTSTSSGFYLFPTRASEQQQGFDQKTVASEQQGEQDDAQVSAHAIDADELAWIYSKLAEKLTAANMFYWMILVRVLYYAVGLILNKWGVAYKGSAKKLHLVSYWVQFSTYLPLLAVLAWSLVSIQNDEKYVVKTGLSIFAHTAMLLLALYGMEGFLRPMDKVLLVHRLIFIATLLYVITFHDKNLQNPIYQVTFGAIEALGVCSELAAQWNLIHYRSWSDVSSHEQDCMRPGATLTLQICLICTFLSKLFFITASVVWYVMQFDAIAGSNLVFLVPLVRVLQAPPLIWSFFVQLQLYNRVSNTDPPAVINVKGIAMENFEDYEVDITETANDITDM